jgi:hypothetical protein
MRLINSSTLELEEFFGEAPEYAILSHRWLNEEVSLADMLNGKAANKAGFTKIKRCCEQAVKDGFKYAWVDTCCIDKTSSAELSEAINSMYQWYAEAAVCYAFLADVDVCDVASDDSFAKSVWFLRGWTLQELIAPRDVVFYNSKWDEIGTKESLKTAISAITNIDLEMLQNADPDDFSVAKRMSWASGRTTTRPEDRAYSLLGLFKVNMPMLYGEGDRAFIRLQEEIMKNSDDQTLFAWTSSRPTHGGLLATSPSDFSQCSNIVLSASKWILKPYFATNKGLSIELPLVPWHMDTYLAALDCAFDGGSGGRVAIYLQLLPEPNQYARVLLDGEDKQVFNSGLSQRAEYKQIYVRQKAKLPPPAAERFNGFWIRSLPYDLITKSNDEKANVSEVYSVMKWSDEERLLELPRGSGGTAGAIYIQTGNRAQVLKLGFDEDFNPYCQWGGNLTGPIGPSVDWRSLEAKLDPCWMKIHRSDYLFKGDRLKGFVGMSVRDRISMQYEDINGRMMWVLDITELEGEMHGAICDNCGLVSHSPPHF